MAVELSDVEIGIVGLGYVGLPLLRAFSGKYPVTGFDVSERRVRELQAGTDRTGELDSAELSKLGRDQFTTSAADIAHCNVFIISVPTPIDKDKNPDLAPLISACESIGRVLKPGDTVVFESTVFPGATEEVCVPIMDRLSGLAGGRDYSFGYSPERINPGDKQHRIEDIVKVTSGCDEQTANFVDALYASVITAGTFKAASVRTAEAAKVIENTQRDVNIALINELAVLFDKLGLDTQSVLEAAATKWNFLQFTPGLVGGHCIGVDPYYLTFRALQAGHEPEVILAGRRINDSMADFVAQKLLRLMQAGNIGTAGSRILVMGLTFKENCPDTRNSQVFRVINALEAGGGVVDVYDPWVAADDVSGVKLVGEPQPGDYDAILLAVRHQQIVDMEFDRVRSFGKPACVVFDLKQVFAGAPVSARL